jgi:hypothetical protein
MAVRHVFGQLPRNATPAQRQARERLIRTFEIIRRYEDGVSFPKRDVDLAYWRWQGSLARRHPGIDFSWSRGRGTMSDAARLLDTAQRHLCDLDEIIDRILLPDDLMSESKAVTLQGIAKRHLSAVDEILNNLARLRAVPEARRLVAQLLETSRRMERLAEIAGPDEDED